MAVPCVKNRCGRTYIDEFMPTCLRSAVFLRHSVVAVSYNHPPGLPTQSRFRRLSQSPITSLCGTKGVEMAVMNKKAGVRQIAQRYGICCWLLLLLLLLLTVHTGVGGDYAASRFQFIFPGSRNAPQANRFILLLLLQILVEFMQIENLRLKATQQSHLCSYKLV